MMLPLTLIVFFLSGFAALLYQVIWQRMLAIFSGADIYSATIIVAASWAGSAPDTSPAVTPPTGCRAVRV
jgi:uncharacterized membrane protein